jgi:MFS family permease
VTVTTRLFGEEGTVIRDRQFQLLLLANLNAPLGIALVSPLLDSLLGPFGVSPTRIGLIITVFTAPSIVMTPLVGGLADRYGRKPMVVIGLVLFGTAGGAISFTTSFPLILVLRSLQGVAHAGLTPVIVTSIGDRYADAEEATAQGLRFATSGFTQAVFPMISGCLVTISWRYSFLLYFLAIPIAGILLVGFSEPTVKSGSSDENETIRSGTVSGLLKLAVQPHVLSTLVTRGLPNFVYFGLLTYLSFVVVRILGKTPAQAGLIVAVTSITYAGAATQAGRITAVFNSRAPPLVIAHICMGGGMALVAAAPSLLIVAGGTVGVGLGVGISASLYRSLLTGIAPDRLRGGLVALGESSGRLASTIVPITMSATTTLLEPAFGFDIAIRLTVLGVGILSTAIGIGGTYVSVTTSTSSGASIID